MELKFSLEIPDNISEKEETTLMENFARKVSNVNFDTIMNNIECDGILVKCKPSYQDKFMKILKSVDSGTARITEVVNTL